METLPPAPPPVEVPAAAIPVNLSALLERAFMFLEDGEFERADEFCEQILNQDPRCARAYLGKLLAELKVNTVEALADCAEPFDGNNHFQKTVRFADPELAEQLNGYLLHIRTRNEESRKEKIYQQGIAMLNAAGTVEFCQQAEQIFLSLEGYKDAAEWIKQCRERAEDCSKNAIYTEAVALSESSEEESVQKAIALFTSIADWKDSKERAAECLKLLEDLEEDALIAEQEWNASKKRMITVLSILLVVFGCNSVVPFRVAHRSCDSL